MKQIPLTKGKFALVDDEDFELLSKYKWHCSGGYASRVIRIFMARQIMDEPQGMIVDHRDGNPLNNQKSNLRICNAAQNTANARKSANRKSIYKGVSTNNSAIKPWAAAIQVEGKVRTIGYFAEERHAAMAYDIWAKAIFGEYARLNFKKVGGS